MKITPLTKIILFPANFLSLLLFADEYFLNIEKVEHRAFFGELLRYLEKTAAGPADKVAAVELTEEAHHKIDFYIKNFITVPVRSCLHRS